MRAQIDEIAPFGSTRRWVASESLTRVRDMTLVSVLRRFNRTYTQRIGALDESFLGTGRPLGVSRLLFEVGASPAGTTVRDLRERLDLDSGHLSRMLRRLERDGLVVTEPDPADQRRRVVRLTAAGRAARGRHRAGPPTRAARRDTGCRAGATAVRLRRSRCRTTVISSRLGPRSHHSADRRKVDAYARSPGMLGKPGHRAGQAPFW